MPFYEYHCQACGYTLEELQKVSDSPLVQCPHCDKPALERVISKTGFQLTGSGWYETDFKDKKPQPVQKSEETPATSSEKAVEKKVEKQPEKKVAKESVKPAE